MLTQRVSFVQRLRNRQRVRESELVLERSLERRSLDGAAGQNDEPLAKLPVDAHAAPAQAEDGAALAAEQFHARTIAEQFAAQF